MTHHRNVESLILDMKPFFHPGIGTADPVADLLAPQIRRLCYAAVEERSEPTIRFLERINRSSLVELEISDSDTETSAATRWLERSEAGSFRLLKRLVYSGLSESRLVIPALSRATGSVETAVLILSARTAKELRSDVVAFSNANSHALRLLDVTQFVPQPTWKYVVLPHSVDHVTPSCTDWAKVDSEARKFFSCGLAVFRFQHVSTWYLASEEWAQHGKTPDFIPWTELLSLCFNGLQNFRAVMEVKKYIESAAFRLPDEFLTNLIRHLLRAVPAVGALEEHLFSCFKCVSSHGESSLRLASLLPEIQRLLLCYPHTLSYVLYSKHLFHKMDPAWLVSNNFTLSFALEDAVLCQRLLHDHQSLLTVLELSGTAPLTVEFQGRPLLEPAILSLRDQYPQNFCAVRGILRLHLQFPEHKMAFKRAVLLPKAPEKMHCMYGDPETFSLLAALALQEAGDEMLLFFVSSLVRLPQYKTFDILARARGDLEASEAAIRLSGVSWKVLCSFCPTKERLQLAIKRLCEIFDSEVPTHVREFAVAGEGQAPFDFKVPLAVAIEALRIGFGYQEVAQSRVSWRM